MPIFNGTNIDDAYIVAFLSLKLVLIYISQIALKAHPLYDKKGCDLSKKSFLYLYVYTWDHKKHWYHRTLQIEGHMQNNKATDLGQSLKQGSFYDLYVIQHSY